MILILVEKKMLKSKFSSHHILSFLSLIILCFFSIYNQIGKYIYHLAIFSKLYIVYFSIVFIII